MPKNQENHDITHFKMSKHSNGNLALFFCCLLMFVSLFVFGGLFCFHFLSQ